MTCELNYNDPCNTIPNFNLSVLPLLMTLIFRLTPEIRMKKVAARMLRMMIMKNALMNSYGIISAET